MQGYSFRYEQTTKLLTQTTPESIALYEPILMDFNSWTANILDPIIYPALQKANSDLLKSTEKKKPTGFKDYYMGLTRILTGVNIDLFLRDRQFEWFKKTAQPEYFINSAVQFEVRSQFAELAASLI